MISIYSDGSSCGRPNKPGGYGWIIAVDDKLLWWGYGGDASTTNNVMEAMGAITGIQALLDQKLHRLDHVVELVSDSQYVLGFASGKYHPSTNVALVKRLRALVVEAGIQRTRWVRGHSGDFWNEKCDYLASVGKAEHMPEAERHRRLEKLLRISPAL